jgi:hypothetical protein
MFRVSIVTALVAAVLAALAGTASAATPAAPAAPAAGAAVAPAGTLDLRFVLTKVVAQGKQLIAQGEVVGTVKTAAGATQVVRKPFAAPVRSLTRSTQGTRSTQRANRICDILNLNLAPLRLELLGLIIELDRVVLTIRANSRGGLLGSLLCGLAGPANTNAQAANRLNNALRRGGISALSAATLPLVPTTLPSPALLPPVPAGICTVLDLVLGPLDLNLLGLMIHLDRVHLRITADPNGGILGSLLCGLAGGPLPIPPTPAP